MRTLDAGQSAEIVKKHVSPFHLAKLQMENTTVYLSSGKNIVFEGNSYVPSAIDMGQISFGLSGFIQSNIRILNYEGSAISLALANKLSDATCTIYIVYEVSDDVFTNPLLLCTGSTDPQEINDDYVGLSIVPKNSLFELMPQVYVNKDSGFNYLLKSGTIISWGGEKYEVTYG